MFMPRVITRDARRSICPLSQHVIYEIFTLYPFTIYICMYRVSSIDAEQSLFEIFVEEN